MTCANPREYDELTQEPRDCNNSTQEPQDCDNLMQDIGTELNFILFDSPQVFKKQAYGIVNG